MKRWAISGVSMAMLGERDGIAAIAQPAAANRAESTHAAVLIHRADSTVSKKKTAIKPRQWWEALFHNASFEYLLRPATIRHPARSLLAFAFLLLY